MVDKIDTVLELQRGNTRPSRDKSRLIHMQRQLAIFEDWADEMENGDLLMGAISESLSLTNKFLENYE